MNYEDDKIDTLSKHLDKRFDKIEKILERMDKIKDVFDGDELLDNQDLCTILKVTKRTLQRYRQLGMISYYQIDGKCYYKKSELETFLKRHEKK